MALRGFYNDNLSQPGRSSSGPELRRDIDRVLKKGGAVRNIYEQIEGRIPLSETQGQHGLAVAGMVAAAVYGSLSTSPDQHPKAFSLAGSFISKYSSVEEYF